MGQIISSFSYYALKGSQYDNEDFGVLIGNSELKYEKTLCSTF